MQTTATTLHESIELGKAYQKILDLGLTEEYYTWAKKLLADESIEKVKVSRGGTLTEEPFNFNKLIIEWVAEKTKG